jgi:TetR/AcrR family transcriptional regulator, mexCD-oprJ operon repressor
VPARPALRDHIAVAILDAAAAVLAERGEAASMADVAEAAGVGRATLYRYFPSRDALLDALVENAIGEIRDRIAGAELEKVPVQEGVARLARALVTAGSKYLALMPHGAFGHQRQHTKGEDERLVVEPLLALIRRGIAEGILRDDLPAETLLEMFGRLNLAAIDRVTRDHIGVEQASAEVTSVFLHGALAPAPHD